MHQWLGSNGLPSPDTALATPAALERMALPAVLKPREGSGAKAVRLARDRVDLDTIDPTRWLLQEQLGRPEVGIDVFLSRDANRFCCVCKEYLQRTTVLTKTRLFHDPALAKIAETLARGIPIFGAFLLQVMHDDASNWRIIDVNPRVGSGVRMSAAVGLDFAAANLADYWGEPTDASLRPLVGESYVVRQYADYVTRRA